MSDQYPTIDSLVALGFERRVHGTGMDAAMGTVGYRFRYLDLKATGAATRYFQPIVLLGGVLNTGRSLGIIEHHIPPDLETPEEAAAWVSYALRSDRSELEPLPPWYLEGERHWDLVPPARKEREAQERSEAYQNCPKCFIDREYARILRRKLQTALSQTVGETEMTFGFDGRVLSIALGDTVYEVVASGKGWPSSYYVAVSPKTPLPARFASSTVTVSVFEGCLNIDGRRLAPLTSEYSASNKVVTMERYRANLERLKKKRATLNAGIDPE